MNVYLVCITLVVVCLTAFIYFNMEFELEKLLNGMEDTFVHGDKKWEDRYQKLFERYSSLKVALETEIKTKADLETKLRMHTKEQDVLVEKQREWEESMSEISFECQGQRKEVVKLNEKLRCMTKTFVESKEKHRNEMEMISNELCVKQSKVKKVQKTIENVRRDVANGKEKVKNLENQIKILEEKNKDMQTIIDDYREGASLKDVRILDNFDCIFSKYLDAFQNDDSDVRHLFQDRVTQGSNSAFKMLVSLCLEDLLQNISSIVNIIGDLQNLVDISIRLDLYLQLTRYMRVLQYKYFNLFSGAGEEATQRTCAMTKAKMKYEEIELGKARQAFVVALLGKMENQTRQNEEEDKKGFQPLSSSSSSSSRAHNTTSYTHRDKGKKKDLPAGF